MRHSSTASRYIMNEMGLVLGLFFSPSLFWQVVTVQVAAVSSFALAFERGKFGQRPRKVCCSSAKRRRRRRRRSRCGSRIRRPGRRRRVDEEAVGIGNQAVDGGLRRRFGGQSVGASPQRLGPHRCTGSHQAPRRTRRSPVRSRHQHLRGTGVVIAPRHSPLVGDRPSTLEHTSPLASGWQRRVGDEATGGVAMCFKEVEPFTLGSGTRPPSVSTRPTGSARLHRSRAAAVARWDTPAAHERLALAGNSNPA